MAQYRARMMDASTGGEGIYDFEDGDALMSETPVRIIRRFMEHVKHDLISSAYKDYQLNAAFKNDDVNVVTGLGTLILTNQPPIPFAIMISPKAAG